MVSTIATPWAPFDRADPAVAVGLLERIRGRTAEAWVVVEPRPAETPRRRFGGKAARSAYSATISPFADDEAPHFLLYLTFPKGPSFSDRGVSLPPGAVLDDQSKDDATFRVPIATAAADTLGLAMAALDSCAGAPLGDAWRACLGDTYVSRVGY